MSSYILTCKKLNYFLKSFVFDVRVLLKVEDEGFYNMGNMEGLIIGVKYRQVGLKAIKE